MAISATFSLGIGLFVLGVILLGLVGGLLWLASRRRKVMPLPISPPVADTAAEPRDVDILDKSTDAVLVVEGGGTILHLNGVGRQWFHVGEARPHIERLAQCAYPVAEFFRLCSAPGEAQFTLNGRLVLGTSYALPQGSKPAVLVSLREAQSILFGSALQSGDQLRLSAEFARKISASLELEPTLHAILESVEQLIPVDLAEISLWDVEMQRLIPYRLMGLPGDDRRLHKAPSDTWLRTGFTSRLVEQRQTLVVDDLQAYQQSPTVSAGETLKFRSYLGAPLLNGEELVGTLELIAVQPNRFEPRQQEVLGLLSGLAVQAVLNARKYENERSKAADLNGLTSLAQALQDVSDPETLFSRLIESIFALLDVQILGFLLYDEARSLLYGQNPFYGLPPNVVDLYRTVIQPGSEGERLLNSAGLMVSEQPSQDTRLEALGLQSIAQAAGFRQIVLAPLASAGRVVGYLQVANPRSEKGFDAPSLRRLSQIATQVSPIVDNALLVHDSRRRAQRSETLRRIASLIGSTATLDEILKYSLLDLARLLQADVAVLLLLDRERGELHPHLASLYGIDRELLAQFSSPSDEGGEHAQWVTNTHRSLLSGALEGEILHPLYRHLVDVTDLHSGIIVPLISREQGVGELLIASRQPDFYERSDERSLFTAAGQLAAAIEQAALASQTDENLGQQVEQLTTLTRLSRELNSTVENNHLLAETRTLTDDLEKRVVLRTRELAAEHQRTNTLLRIITELSASLDIDQVLQRTLHVLNEFIGAQQVSIWLSRPGHTELKRLASLGSDRLLSGLPDQEQELAQQVLDSQTLLRLDELPNSTASDSEGSLHSALAVPLRIGAEILGVLLVFSNQKRYFTQGHHELVQAAANQIAVAVNNAELYHLIRDQAEDLGGMLRSQQIETSRSQAILEAVADGVLVTDNQMTITLFNASAEKILSLDRGQVVGKTLEYFSGLFGQAAHTWIETIQGWSHAPLRVEPGFAYAERLDLENGRVVEVHLAPVSLRRDFLGTVSIFQDITHQVEVDRLKSEFVATVSHELRTPMTSIKGYVEIMLMGAAGSLSEKQTQFLEVVRENTDRLTVLVDDLLNISKIESGRIELNPQPLALDGLVNEALRTLEQRSAEEGKAIHFSTDLPPDLPRAWADEARVRQVLENLLDNAYLYNTAGGTIHVRARPHPNAIQVDVVDSGMGIPPGEQARIFERFYRGETPLTLGVAGTGLGLSIVQSLVQLQGGRIWLDSPGIPGQGSTFSFTLPLDNGQENNS